MAIHSVTVFVDHYEVENIVDGDVVMSSSINPTQEIEDFIRSNEIDSVTTQPQAVKYSIDATLAKELETK